MPPVSPPALSEVKSALEQIKQEADSFKISANMPCSKKFETS